MVAKGQNARGFASKIAGCLSAMFRSIHGYFLVSGILYILASGIVYASYFIIHLEMCAAIAKPPCNDNILMGDKDTTVLAGKCWRYATNITYLDRAATADSPLYTTLTAATQDADCNDLIRRESSPIQMIAGIALFQLSTGGVKPTTSCLTWNCEVLYTAAFSSRYTILQSAINNGTWDPCTNQIPGKEYNIKPDNDADECTCHIQLQKDWTDLYTQTALWWRNDAGDPYTLRDLLVKCVDVFKDDPDYITYLKSLPAATPAPATPAPAAAAGATGRLLQEENGADRCTNGIDCDTASSSAHTISEETAARRLDETDAAATPAATPAANMNDQLPEYSTSSWSKCTCIQACWQGIKTRSVTCPAGQKCQQPAPEASEKCTCSHCADCEFMWPWLIMGGAFGFQAIVSFICFLAFSSIADIGPDELISFGCMRWIVGCFCKFLPLVVRFFVYVSLVCILWLVTVALIPIQGWMTDCKANGLLRLVTLITVSVWAVQLMIGLGMRANQRVPPWLYFSQSKNMKFLCAPCRRIGP